MEKKNEKSISRRGFLSNTGKTLFFATVSASTVPAFLSSCSKESIEKEDNSNILELKGGAFHCHNGSGFVCVDPGFDCPDNNFHCHDMFECHTSFSCDDTNNFHCLGQGAYTIHMGGQGG